MDTSLAMFNVKIARSHENAAMRRAEDSEEKLRYLPDCAYHSTSLALEQYTAANEFWVRALIAILSPPE